MGFVYNHLCLGLYKGIYIHRTAYFGENKFSYLQWNDLIDFINCFTCRNFVVLYFDIILLEEI